MKKFAFYVLLSLSLLVVCCAFDYADAVRGYNATGGEVFTIILPLMVIWSKMETMSHNIQRLKQYNKALQENI